MGQERSETHSGERQSFRRSKVSVKACIGCSQLIGQLEEQVREVKESWDRKEVKLTQERDKALDAAK